MAITEREQVILDYLRADPMISQQDLADRLKISRSAVAVHIMHLMQKGYVAGKGYILAEQSYVAVVGGANIDLSGRSTTALRMGDSNPGSLSVSPGGVGRNIAENLARLGAVVQFFSVVGQDAWGDELLAACRSAGVGVDHVLRPADVSTSVYLSVLDADGEMKLALNDMAALTHLNVAALDKRAGFLDRAHMWVIDANLSEEALQWLFQRRAQQRVIVDTVSAAKVGRLTPYLASIHTLKPNALEAEVLTGIVVQDKTSAQHAAAALHRAGVKRVFLTLGGQGALYSDDGNSFWLDALPVRVVSVTGAGDAALAALTHATLHGWDARRSAQFAMASAALATTSAQTIHPNLSEAAVLQLLESCHA